MEGAITPLWIMAAVSVLEALVLIGVAIGGFIVYRRVMQTISELEMRQIAPLRDKVEGILGDVHAITARVSHETQRVDNAIHTTIGRIDDTAERVRSNVREKTSRVVGFIRGLRVALESVMATRHHA